LDSHVSGKLRKRSQEILHGHDAEFREDGDQNHDANGEEVANTVVKM
jgi:hypothetical protein